MADKSTWIYLIVDPDTGFVKIGRADDIEARLRALRRQPTLLPKPSMFFILEAYRGQESDEKVLHKKFAEYRRRGEWFDLDSQCISQIKTHFYDCLEYRSGRVVKEIEYEEAKKKGVMGPDYFLYEACSGDQLDFLQEGFGIEV